jgi:hypothetical protein
MHLKSNTIAAADRKICGAAICIVANAYTYNLSRSIEKALGKGVTAAEQAAGARAFSDEFGAFSLRLKNCNQLVEIY